MSRVRELDLSVDLLRVLLWQYNDAENLQGILTRKQAWYDSAHTQFWTDWIRDVFDLRTANDFGLAVWAIILDLPLVITSGVDPLDKVSWGFGVEHVNFGNGNFSANSSEALTTEQKRIALRLRYFQLVTRGAVPEVNEFLKYLFGNVGGAPLAPGVYAQYTAEDVASCTRAGAATGWSAGGALVDVPANTLRYARDPITGDLQGVLVEAATINYVRNNMQVGAVPGSPGVTPNKWSVTNTAPNGVVRTLVGLFEEDGILFSRWSFVGVATSAITVTFGTDATNVVPAASGQTWTAGVMARMSAGSMNGVTNPRVRCLGYNVTPAIQENTDVAIANFATAARLRDTITQATRTMNNPATIWARNSFAINFANGAAIDVTMDIALPQLEQAAAMSSIVKTNDGGFITRNADVVRISDPNAVGKVYVVDSQEMAVSYVFPPGLLPSALESALLEYDLLPRPAGVRSRIVTDGEADGFGFGRYHQNFNNGNFYHV